MTRTQTRVAGVSFCLESSNEATGNGYIDNSSEVVCVEMFLRMKTAANRSFLTVKLKKVAIQPTIGSASVSNDPKGN